MSDLQFSCPRTGQHELIFPQQLTEKYAPQTIDDFVGLDKPKKILRALIANPRPSAWLFLGPSGTGKTTAGLVLAKMLPAELHHIPSQECNLDNIERVRRTCQYVPIAGCRFHVVLVDEADQMSAAAQVSLLSKLDATNFPPATIFVFTANSTDRLEPRFLSRLHVVEFTSYGLSREVASLLECVWKRETTAEPPNFARMVKESNNNVREALTKLEVELMCA